MEELSEAELLMVLARQGTSASPAQLARWRQAGLLSASTHSLGRGRGTRTSYPASAAMQAIAIADELTRVRDLNAVGWRLWRQGFDVADRCWREPLLKAARTADSVLRYFRLLERPGLSDRHDDKLYGASKRLSGLLQNHPGTSLIRRARKACGATRFGAFVDAMIQIGAGTYHVSEHPRDGRYDLATLDAGFGFTNARRNFSPGSSPWLPVDYRPEMATVSLVLSHGQLIDDLQAATAAELRSCVDQLDRLWTALRAFLSCCEATYGRQGLGLTRLSAFLTDGSVHAQAGMVVFWLRLRPTLGHDAERFIREHETTVRLAEEISHGRIPCQGLPLRTTTQHWPEAMLAVARGEAIG